jgi:hypothetical protein
MNSAAVGDPGASGSEPARSAEDGGILDHEFIDPVQGAWRMLHGLQLS